jgi:hypothetical protein
MGASKHTRTWRIKHFGRQNQLSVKINLFKQLHESMEPVNPLHLFEIESVCPQIDIGDYGGDESVASGGTFGPVSASIPVGDFSAWTL